MRRRLAVTLALVALSGGATACSDEGTASVSTDVSPVHATTLTTTGAVLRIPPGSASGGTVTLGPAALPDDVPSGVEPLGPAAAVLLEGGSLTAPASISFAAPEGLARGDIPVVVWRQPGGGWAWLPTTPQDKRRRLAADFTEPTAGFLARVDATAWLDGFVDEFVGRVTATAGAEPPTCSDEAAAVAAGLEPGSDAGEQVRWCLGVHEAGPVLKVTNDTRLYQQVTHPDTWQVTAGQGLPVAALDGLLALGTTTEAGSAATLLAAGETLALRLPHGPGVTEPTAPSGAARVEVTAAVTAQAWTVSSLVAGAAVYREVAERIDRSAGKVVARLARGLPGALARSSAVAQRLHRCLAPAHGLTSLDRAAADRILTTAFGCLPAVLRPADNPALDRAVNQLVHRVGTETLTRLSAVLDTSEDAWAAVPGENGDSSFRIWLGEPPPEELDYSGAPQVFGVGDDAEVASPPEWTAEFRGYVDERLALLGGSDPSSGCPSGSFGVRRLRSDGYALATQVDCDGEVHQVVLKRLADGWHEIDDTDVRDPAADAAFSCDLMALHSVPPFIAGDRCLSGSEPQDYP